MKSSWAGSCGKSLGGLVGSHCKSLKHIGSDGIVSLKFIRSNLCRLRPQQLEPQPSFSSSPSSL